MPVSERLAATANLNAESFVAAALTVRKLATLIRAGLPLTKARQQLVGEIGQLDSQIQEQLGNLAIMSERYGSPLSWVLDSLSEHYLQQAQLLGRITLTSAMPRATSKLVAWLPIFCLVGAQLFGLGPITAILHNSVAAGSAVVGLLLLVLNRWVMNRLIATVEQAAGRGMLEVMALVEVALALQAGLPSAKLSELELPTEVLEVLQFASVSGSSIVDLVRGEADVRYLAFNTQVELQAEKLQMRLLAPLGFLVLPSLLFLAIIPTAVTLITN